MQMQVPEIISSEEIDVVLKSLQCDCNYTKKIVQRGVKGINELQLWNWFRTYDPPVDKGYIFDKHPNTNAMAEYTNSDGHSAASFAITMRYLQKIAKILSKD